MKEIIKNSILKHIFWLASLAAAYVYMLSLSWRKWPDSLVDYGRELYVSWQISQGAVLYKDLYIMYGPLAQHINGILFKIFGAGLMVLVWFNILFVGFFIYLTYRFFSHVFDQFTAWAGCMMFIFVFACNQYVGTGNYNYICPYSYSLTYGLILSLISLYQFYYFIETKRKKYLLVSMGLAGLVFLTKVEVFLALSCGLFIWVVLLRYTKLMIGRLDKLFLLKLLLAVCFSTIVMFSYFWIRAGFFVAVKGILYQYYAVAGGSIIGNQFFKVLSGLDDLSLSLKKIVSSLIVYAVCWISLSLIAKFIRKKSLFIAWITAITVSLGFIIWAWSNIHSPWINLARCWPGLCLIAVVYCIFKIKKSENKLRLSAVIVFCLFSLILLSKMLFNVHVFHYGFALAMPAGLILTMLFFGLGFKKIADNQNIIKPLGLIAGCLIAVVFINHVLWAKNIYNHKTVAISSGKDLFYDFSPLVWNKGKVMADLTQYLSENIKPGQTMVVFPEGIMLNYLTRTKNPVPRCEFLSPLVDWWGEDKVLAELVKAKPDYVVITHKDNSEFGPRFFGKDYDVKIFNWIKKEYQPVVLFGDQPLVNEKFGAIVAKRIQQ